MQDRIKHLRSIATDVLKPTPAALEHGLELHEQSVVIDGYGFSPRTLADVEAVRAAVEQGATDIEFQDISEETSMTGVVLGPDEQAEYRAAWDAAGVTCIFQNAAEEGQAIARMIKRLARFTYVTDVIPDVVSRAVRPADIVDAHEAGRHCVAMSSNGVPLREHWETVEEELAYIRVFFQLGVRMAHVTYNRRNMLGDGCAEPANAGLSDLGRAAVREMNRVGMLVDVAHAGWRTSLEAAQVSEKPIVASHTGCVSVNEHVRCKPDEVIRAIAEGGGVVGVCCIPAFLGGAGDLNALLDHIDHIVKLVGVDHVSIGTDAAFISPRAQEALKAIPSRGPRRPRFRSFWPPDDPLFDPKWHSDERTQSVAWMNWPIYTVGLVQRGYSDDDVQKIIGGNVLRVAGDVLRGSHFGGPLLGEATT